jgi:hypothetical protein
MGNWIAQMWRAICDFPDENRPPICGKLQRALCYNAMGFTFKNEVERPSQLLNKKHSALYKNISSFVDGFCY